MALIDVAGVRSALSDLELDDLDTIKDDESLFDAGVLDSLRLIELVSGLEREFGVKIRHTDLTPTNFDTITGMTSLLARLRSGGAAS